MNTTQVLLLIQRISGLIDENDIAGNVYTYILHVVVFMASLLFIVPFIFRQIRWVLGAFLQALTLVCFLLLMDHYSGNTLSSYLRIQLSSLSGSLSSNSVLKNYLELFESYYDLYINHLGRYYHDIPHSWKARADYETFKNQQSAMVQEKEGYMMRTFLAISAAIGGFVIGNRNN